MSRRSKIEQRVTAGVFVIVLLSCCLCLTTYALYHATVQIDNNYFKTGIVNIDLNGGEPVIEEHEYLFEPGMTVEKPFYILNKSTCEVYYKIYLSDVQGGLADVLQVTVLDGDREVFSATAREMTRTNVGAADDLLGLGERRDLTIRFHFPQNGAKISQNQSLRFSLCADAVQEKNNPNREFD